MSDVAALAGVSHQTVSRVLNGHPSVRAETRRRVQEAIATLGYRPNTAARALVTRRTGTIGVVTSGSALFGPTSTLIGLERAAREAGLYVSVATTSRPGTAGMHPVLEHFMSQGVDGVVVIAGHDDAVAAVRAYAPPVPTVMVGPTDLHDRSGLRSVAVDQYAGARRATRHLLDLGHRHVLHLAGPQDWLDARNRLRGWRDELAVGPRDVGHSDVGDSDVVPCTWEADRGYEVARDLLAAHLPTAVFAANDQLALGALRAFAEAGVRVPDDVSVVGFDDIDGAANFYPPLTTVRQDFGALGRRCVKLLLATIAGEDIETGLITPDLVVRASTAAPRV
jgi:DNA-binding LacI/PurR family transcriptional regulator